MRNILEVERTSFADKIVPETGGTPVTEIPPPPVPIAEVFLSAVAAVFNSKILQVSIRFSDKVLVDVTVTVALTCHNGDIPDQDFSFTTVVPANTTLFSYLFRCPLVDGSQPLYTSVVALVTNALPNPAGGSDLIMPGA